MSATESRKTWFVEPHSVVRKIWGTSDTVLFIFAGAAAEFSLNRAVDWLFFTGRLPADPLGRLFSTVAYARRIVFSPLEEAHEVIDRMAEIHRAVEHTRGSVIPAWAYRDVLYMLIDYSIRSHELLFGRMKSDAKNEVYDVFFRVGARMEIPSLPQDYVRWLPDRNSHMENDLEASAFTHDLYKQYRRHLGMVRYRILLGAQAAITPEIVKRKLRLRDGNLFRIIIPFYRMMKTLGLDWTLKKIVMPPKYIEQVKQLDRSDRS
jgi:uncharacterized protein (DUF2236 family)